jgi:hypothetical protein
MSEGVWLIPNVRVARPEVACGWSRDTMWLVETDDDPRPEVL